MAEAYNVTYLLKGYFGQTCGRPRLASIELNVSLRQSLERAVGPVSHRHEGGASTPLIGAEKSTVAALPKNRILAICACVTREVQRRIRSIISEGDE